MCPLCLGNLVPGGTCSCIRPSNLLLIIRLLHQYRLLSEALLIKNLLKTEVLSHYILIPDLWGNVMWNKHIKIYLFSFQNHAIVHFSSKNYECSVCGFRSKRCESLAVHMRRHQDVKPFRCGICGREYTQKRSLQMHLPYHLTDLQIKCRICSKRCVTK